MRTQLRIVAGSLEGPQALLHGQRRPSGRRRRWCARPCSASSATPCPAARSSTSSPAPASSASKPSAAAPPPSTFVERDFRLIAELERHIAGLRRRRVGADRAIRRLPLDRALAAAAPNPSSFSSVLPSPTSSAASTTCWAWSAGCTRRSHPGSVVVLQSERGVPLDAAAGPGTIGIGEPTAAMSCSSGSRSRRRRADADRNGEEDKPHDDADGA